MDHQNKNKRRDFLKNTLTAATGITVFPLHQGINSSMINDNEVSLPYLHRHLAPEVRFGVIGLNHGHIYGQTNAIIRNGGKLVSVYAKEEDLLDQFVQRYPGVNQARSEEEILEDSTIQLILSAGIPIDRAPLGIKVMQHDKDYMVDKPGIITLQQLEEVRKVQAQTRKIYSIMYSERLENRATVKAGELVQSGAIGKVVQTIGLGPHRIRLSTRPSWFYEKKYFGGIICDIGSHQFDQFLYFTGFTSAKIISSQTGNVHYPQYPEFEDFGDVTLQGNKGAGYIRVDWFTPDGLDSWGDGRLTVLGTEGYIEIRKNVDIGGRAGGNHLFLVNNKDTIYINCEEIELPYGRQLIYDVVNRTETAMSQEHCFLATELALRAQAQATNLKLD
ncbi:MAG: Gfo/Idh/MocA family oxidoreductase [Saprospiraceae bacterium]|nr:Gfo/Idh/MocA family oxidoreductase [Saprospiraceae bacterium]